MSMKTEKDVFEDEERRLKRQRRLSLQTEMSVNTEKEDNDKDRQRWLQTSSFQTEKDVFLNRKEEEPNIFIEVLTIKGL